MVLYLYRVNTLLLQRCKNPLAGDRGKLRSPSLIPFWPELAAQPKRRAQPALLDAVGVGRPPALRRINRAPDRAPKYRAPRCGAGCAMRSRGACRCARPRIAHRALARRRRSCSRWRRETSDRADRVRRAARQASLDHATMARRGLGRGSCFGLGLLCQRAACALAKSGLFAGILRFSKIAPFAAGRFRVRVIEVSRFEPG